MSKDKKWGLLEDMTKDLSNLVRKMDNPIEAAQYVIMNIVLSAGNCEISALGLLEKCKFDAQEIFRGISEDETKAGEKK